MRVTLPAASPKGEQASSFLRLGGAALPVAGSPTPTAAAGASEAVLDIPLADSAGRAADEQGPQASAAEPEAAAPKAPPAAGVPWPLPPAKGIFPGTGNVSSANLGSPAGSDPAAPASSGSLAAGAASKLAFTVQPTDGAAVAAISPAVQVTVEDGLGNPVTTDNTTQVTLSLASNPGGSTLSGTLTRTAANGVATFNNLSLNNPAAGYTLGATSTPATSTTTSTTFTVTAGAASKLAFTVQPTDGAAGAAISPAVQVTVEDGLGNPVTTDNTTQVTLSLASNPGGSTSERHAHPHRGKRRRHLQQPLAQQPRRRLHPRRDQHPGHQHHHQHHLHRYRRRGRPAGVHCPADRRRCGCGDQPGCPGHRRRRPRQPGHD